MANEENLKPFTGADDPRRGHPKKGSKHISTWIQEMLSDEDFETVLTDARKGAIDYKGAPLKAIIKVAMHKAIHDKEKGQQWAEWLAKYGWGNKVVHDFGDDMFTQATLTIKVVKSDNTDSEREATDSPESAE